MTSSVIGIGEVLWDLLPSGKQLGGAPANFAYHCKALSDHSISSYIISSVGNDAGGKAIQAALHQLGVDCQWLHFSQQYKTGSVSVTIDDKGIPAYLIEPDVAWDYIPDIEADQIKTQGNHINIACFGSLAQRSETSRQNIHNFLQQLPDATIKIFDINLRQNFYTREIIETSLEIANVFKINDDELNVLSQLLNLIGNEEQRLVHLSKKYSLHLCILTKGEYGSLIYSDHQFSHHAGITVKTLDTVGAGDAFTAAIAIGLIKQLDLDYMHDCASQVAAYVCSCAGATPQLPHNLVDLFNN